MPGTKFTVVADPLHHHGGLHIVHLEEIPDEDDDDNVQDQKPAKETTITKSMGKLDISSSTSAVSKPVAAKWQMPPEPPKPKPSVKEFAEPGQFEERYCKGRLCAKCGRCRDWYFTGDLETWKWVQNWESWSDGDRQRYNNGIWKRWTKRQDGPTCYDSFRRRSSFRYCVCADNYRS